MFRKSLAMGVFWLLTGYLVGADPRIAAPAPAADPIDSFLVLGEPKFAQSRSLPCTDLEFLRRVHLDLVGSLPTVEEARRFEADPNPAKRAQLVDKLLASPAHSWHMAEVLDVWWMERRPDKVISTTEWRAWLRDSLLGGEPLDFLVRDILLADGTVKETRPAARFFLDRECEPNLVARDIARLFMGANLQCAQCHDHPRVTDYTQEKYQGLVAFLIRSRQMTDPKLKMAVIAEKAEGETTFVSVFDKGKVQKKTGPKLPGGRELSDPMLSKGSEYLVAPGKEVREVPRYSRRSQLAGLLAQGGYQPFARNMANRLWALVMGKGLVHPLDMHHDDNPPSHPELLDYLADELIRQRFDHRAFLRSLVLSQAYQRSSIPQSGGEWKKPDTANHWQGMPLRPLPPETFARAILQATGWMDGEVAGLAATPPAERETVLRDRMKAAMGPLVSMLKGQPGVAEEFDPRVDQALFFQNNAHILNLMGQRPGSLMSRLLALKDADAVIEEIHLSVLTRHASAAEKADWAPEVKAAMASGQTQTMYRQLIWALLASAEFRFVS